MWWTLLFGLWLAWCAGNLLCMMMVKPRGPSYNGFRVRVPENLRLVLSEEEYQAITAHELGHKYWGHAWENYAGICLFKFRDKERAREQELEADDYAASLGFALPLATALRKLGGHRFDHERAARLLESDAVARRTRATCDARDAHVLIEGEVK